MKNSEKPSNAISYKQNTLSGTEIHFYTGLTKKEYTMIHAPSVIPDWFEPKMRERPQRVTDYYNYASVEEKKLIAEWHLKAYPKDDYLTLRDYIEDSVENVSDTLQAAFDSEDDDLKWQQERTIERYFQWREYFATKILEHENPDDQV